MMILLRLTSKKIYNAPCQINAIRQGLFFCSAFNLHPARQLEHDPVLAVHRQAVHQPGPQALVKLGDELRKALHAIDEPLDLPAADHDLTDLLDDLTQKSRMRMHTVMHSHPIFCPNLSTKGPNQFAFQNCLMNTCLSASLFLQKKPLHCQASRGLKSKKTLIPCLTIGNTCVILQMVRDN